MWIVYIEGKLGKLFELDHLNKDLRAAASWEKAWSSLFSVKCHSIGVFPLTCCTQAQLQRHRANVFPTYRVRRRRRLHSKKCICRHKIRRNVLRLAGMSVWNPNQMQEINRDVSPDSSGWYLPLSQDNSCSVQGQRPGHTVVCIYGYSTATDGVLDKHHYITFHQQALVSAPAVLNTLQKVSRGGRGDHQEWKTLCLPSRFRVCAVK